MTVGQDQLTGKEKQLVRAARAQPHGMDTSGTRMSGNHVGVVKSLISLAFDDGAEVAEERVKGY